MANLCELEWYTHVETIYACLAGGMRRHTEQHRNVCAVHETGNAKRTGITVGDLRVRNLNCIINARDQTHS